MTIFLRFAHAKMSVVLLLLIINVFQASAQDFLQLRQQKLEGLDLQGLGSNLLLNNGVISRYEVDHFDFLAKSKSGIADKVTSEEWQNLYERLIETDLRPKNSRIPDLEKLVYTESSRLTKSNIIPIGIMNLRSIYLSGSQISENEASKRKKVPVNFSNYNKTNIVYASVLQEDLYQSDVSFRISQDLVISNQKEQIGEVEINFNDGKGFKKYLLSEKLIPYRFQSLGEQHINFRFTANGTIYHFETKINVQQLERRKPYKEFQINADRVWKDTTFSNTPARTALVGGNIRIVLGCDQLLNKPIIIAEGFDLGQDVNLDNLEAKYTRVFGSYLAEGYDLVFLDYADARDAIQNNTQVLKGLIQQINTMKIGTEELIVVGESMSGLVGRWAIREMEQDAVAHHVRLLICYDTPHQGANIPVGITQLYWDAQPTILTNVVLKFLAKGWRNYYQALTTPAGAQLLMHWGGNLTGGVGSKSPAFDQFRTDLVALGNGGYPQNCRNIALVHGSMNAGDRALFNTYNYGSRILLSFTPWGLQNTNIDVHTNQLNQNANVLRFATWGLFANAIGISRNYNSPFNDDFVPGGRSNFAIPSKLFGSNKTQFEFCFVPTFSSIDFQGARNTQNDRELLNVVTVNAATVNRQTPFAAIYGRNDQINTAHVTAQNVSWNDLGTAEGLFSGVPACPAVPPLPQPTFSGFNTCYLFSAKRTTEDNVAHLTVTLNTPSNGQYVHKWMIIPLNQYFTSTSDQVSFDVDKPGQYQVTCVRTYPNRADVSSTFTATINVTECGVLPFQPETPTFAYSIVNDNWEGDFVLSRISDNSNVFAHYTGVGKLYASLSDGTFISRAQLETSGMFTEFSQYFAATDPRTALPVNLVEFNAVSENQSALLSWKTTSETNSDHFDVEKSIDAKNWNKIGVVAANFNSESIKNYAFVDKNPGAKLAYYRLKMVDTDQTFAYSRLESVRFSQHPQTVVYPNPADSGEPINLLNNDQVYKVQVYDLSGKLRYESENIQGGIKVQDLPTGRYIIKITMKDGSENSHVFVKK